MFHRFVSNKIKVTFQSNNILWVHQYLWVKWKSKCKNAFMFIANGYIIQYVFNILHINDFFIRESTQQRNLRKLAFTDYWWNHDVLSILINIENVNKLFYDFFHRKRSQLTCIISSFQICMVSYQNRIQDVKLKGTPVVGSGSGGRLETGVTGV